MSSLQHWSKWVDIIVAQYAYQSPWYAYPYHSYPYSYPYAARLARRGGEGAEG